MFYDCTFVKTFWTNVENWWEKIFHGAIQLDYKSIIFGIDVHNSEVLLENVCIILAKKAIYNCSIKNKKPNMSSFLYFVHHR